MRAGSRLLKSFDGAKYERLRNSFMCTIPLMVSPLNHQSTRSNVLPKYPSALLFSRASPLSIFEQPESRTC
jgi:hypothetical protein